MAFSIPANLQLVDAIIGLTVLKRSNFTIDYESKKLCFGAVRHSPSAITFSSERYVMVRVSVGSRTLNLAIDTGAKDLILYQRRVKELESAIPTREGKTFQHFGGSSRLRGVTLEELRLGDRIWKRVDAFLLEGKRRDAYPEGVDGVISALALKVHRLHFDFQNHVLSWEMPRTGAGSSLAKKGPRADPLPRS